VTREADQGTDPATLTPDRLATELTAQWLAAEEE
jgi:hypothetical protein